jgi:hypothetical protein
LQILAAATEVHQQKNIPFRRNGSVRVYALRQSVRAPSECTRSVRVYALRQSVRAPSECTRSVRAVRDTPVADYSTPALNTSRRVVYRPRIAVSLSLRVLSVSNFKRSLSHCGQL